MRYRDQIRCISSPKKGTSKARRKKLAVFERLAEGIINEAGVRRAAEQAVIDQLIYGQSFTRVSWGDQSP